MIPHSLTPRRSAWARLWFAFPILCGSVTAQDFALQVADPNPLGIGRFVPTRADLLDEVAVLDGILKGAFAFDASLQTVYDSNFFLTENNTEDELSVLFIPAIRYTSDPTGGALFSLTANYSPVFRAFLDNSDLNDIDQVGDIAFTLHGNRTEATVFGRYRELSGTDRFTGNFSTGRMFTGGIRASRAIATRTSINGGFTYSKSDYDSGVNVGSDVYNAYIGGMWSASERLGYGATLNYSRKESDNTGTRDAWALLAEVRYRLGERIWLSASLGPEFSSDSGSRGDSVNLRANIQSRYVINERWSWVNSLLTATVPSPGSAGYIINNYGISSEVEHRLLRATVRGGIDFNYSDYDAVGDVLAVRSNERNLGLFLAYNRGFFNERVSFDSSVRYRTNNGGVDWDQWQVAAGISVPF